MISIAKKPDFETSKMIVFLFCDYLIYIYIYIYILLFINSGRKNLCLVIHGNQKQLVRNYCLL